MTISTNLYIYLYILTCYDLCGVRNYFDRNHHGPDPDGPEEPEGQQAEAGLVPKIRLQVGMGNIILDVFTSK